MRKHGREFDRLAQAQVTFQRLATLVARGAPPAELFTAFADELGQLLPGSRIAVARYEPDGSVTAVAAWERAPGCVTADAKEMLAAAELGTAVFESNAPVRVESREVSDLAGSRIAVPISVEGRIWGAMVACSGAELPLPADAEERLSGFAELIGTVMANAESRTALVASRARIVAAADVARRRIERDLHDGAQQRLVSLALELRAAQAAVPDELGELRGELSRVAEGMAALVEELRTIARGIHPAILDTGGLGPALKALARRSPVPVEIQVRTEARLPEQTEVAAYYVVSETLTNVAKHAQATRIQIAVEAGDRTLRVVVADDGVGGANASRGSGLVGLTDRVEALGGSLTLHSPPGAGTTVEVELPLDEQAAAPSG